MGGTLGLGEAGRGGWTGRGRRGLTSEYDRGVPTGPGRLRRVQRRPKGLSETGYDSDMETGRDKVPTEAAPPPWEATLQGKACSDSSLNSSRTPIRSEEERRLSTGC